MFLQHQQCLRQAKKSDGQVAQATQQGVDEIEVTGFSRDEIKQVAGVAQGRCCSFFTSVFSR